MSPFLGPQVLPAAISGPMEQQSVVSTSGTVTLSMDKNAGIAVDSSPTLVWPTAEVQLLLVQGALRVSTADTADEQQAALQIAQPEPVWAFQNVAIAANGNSGFFKVANPSRAKAMSFTYDITPSGTATGQIAVYPPQLNADGTLSETNPDDTIWVSSNSLTGQNTLAASDVSADMSQYDWFFVAIWAGSVAITAASLGVFLGPS